MRLLVGNVHANLDKNYSFHESKYAMQKPYAMPVSSELRVQFEPQAQHILRILQYTT